MSLAKGKTTSSASRIPEGDAEPTNLTTGTIRMLKNKYGLAVSSMHTVVGETPSTLHWLLQGGKKFVNKDMEGDHWEWVSPDDDTVGEKRKLKDTGNDQLSQLELLQEVIDSAWVTVEGCAASESESLPNHAFAVGITGGEQDKGGGRQFGSADY